MILFLVLECFKALPSTFEPLKMKGFYHRDSKNDNNCKDKWLFIWLEMHIFLKVCVDTNSGNFL